MVVPSGTLTGMLFILRFIIVIYLSTFLYRAKLASRNARAALNALSCVDFHGGKLMSRGDVSRSRNGSRGALTSAHTATDTFVFVDIEVQKLFANAGGAFFVHNVSDIFVFKVS